MPQDLYKHDSLYNYIEKGNRYRNIKNTLIPPDARHSTKCFILKALENKTYSIILLSRV